VNRKSKPGKRVRGSNPTFATFEEFNCHFFPKGRRSGVPMKGKEQGVTTAEHEFAKIIAPSLDGGTNGSSPQKQVGKGRVARPANKY
jgi:hypothetical protein